jgi:hypothetical protein
LWLRPKTRRRIRRDVNAYSKTYTSLHILLELLGGCRGRDEGDIRRITLKDPSGIFNIKRLIILLPNVFKVGDISGVLYAFKLDFRPGS